MIEFNVHLNKMSTAEKRDNGNNQKHGFIQVYFSLYGKIFFSFSLSAFSDTAAQFLDRMLLKCRRRIREVHGALRATMLTTLSDLAQMKCLI